MKYEIVHQVGEWSVLRINGTIYVFHDGGRYSTSVPSIEWNAEEGIDPAEEALHAVREEHEMAGFREAVEFAKGLR